MKLQQLPSLRFSLIFLHRWLGIAIGLMFVLWTISAVILMYYGIPHHTAGERLSRLPPLDLSTAAVSPQQALDTVGGTPFRLRISMHDDRPVYRINTGTVFGEWTLVYADTGDVMTGVDEDTAIFTLAKLYPEYAEEMRYEGFLREPDMFTHSPALQTQFPLHRIGMGNRFGRGDTYYVS